MQLGPLRASGTALAARSGLLCQTSSTLTTAFVTGVPARGSQGCSSPPHIGRGHRDEGGETPKPVGPEVPQKEARPGTVGSGGGGTCQTAQARL